MNTKNSKTCFCCKKSGHNISTCISARKQGILIENHMQALIDICGENESKIRTKISHYLRNLSLLQQKILCVRIGGYENHLSCSILLRYFMDKQKSRKVMMKLYGGSGGGGGSGSGNSFLSIPAEPISCPSFSKKSERKRIL
jgi:hypothetical protein